MFTHLHVHTEYSLLDGMCRLHPLLSRARELGMDSLAITDHGALFGIVQFYQVAREVGIRPILGCEIYLAASDRHARSSSDKSPFHLVLLARDKEGYRNLIRLVTKAHLEGFYYKPRADKELLREHSRGLIALSACTSGEVPRLILEGRLDQAREAALWYKECFDGNFYLEVQRHPIPEVERASQGLVLLGHELGIPLVATNDVHYVSQGDASAHELLLCIQTNTSVYDDKRMKMASDTFYLKSPAEMMELFADLPEAVENTQRISERCSLELEFGRLHLPEPDIPEGTSPDEYLSRMCWEGLRRRHTEVTSELEKRLDYELDVIRHTQFANYFLVVWDIVSFAQRRGILLGVRGSAAASLVLYCLGITDIDPLAYGLVFERFLNVERKELPDIDLDFQDDRRDEVLAYVVQRYGQEHVAQIITFGTLGAKAALRDVGRALGMPYGAVDRVARLVPARPTITLSSALEESAELRNLYAQDSAITNLVDSARRLEGVSRHASTHAAGVVISKEPLIAHVPLQLASRGGENRVVMTQFSMDDIARIGLLKMDFLGLANLNVLAEAVRIIGQEKGVFLDLKQIPLDDARTFELLASGETGGVFQLEGVGMRRYIRELKPSTFNDIAAMIALYRPGPMEHIPTFIKAKHGVEPIRYPHPTLSEILKETYGVIVYQDQVLQIVRAFAGYTLGQADIFRKAMGKKIPEVMKRERENFLSGAQGKGFTSELASQVFALIEPFAGYAFNKAHSTSYAMIAYQTAYLKANYTVEYMTALLRTYAGQQEKVQSAISECRRLGIPVLPPDINRSGPSFAIEQTEDKSKPAIRFGLTVVKNVGEAAISTILAVREKEGAFKTIEDFCRRANLRGLNKRALDSLIKAGALDGLGDRGTLVHNVDRLLSLSQKEQRLRESNQSTMFDLWGGSVPIPLPSLELEKVDVPLKERLSWEKELLGAYLSEHPFSYAARELESRVTAWCGQIGADMAGEVVVIAGVATSVREVTTKDGKPFAVAFLEDLDGGVEVMVWPEVYKASRGLWVEGNMLVVEGKVKLKEERVQVVCVGAELYQVGTGGNEEGSAGSIKEVDIGESGTVEAVKDREPERRGERLVVTFRESDDEGADMVLLRQAVEIIRQYPGEGKVVLRVVEAGKTVNLEIPGLSARICAKLQQSLTSLVGETEVTFEK